ncbi:MAG: methylenetetrahydrofolate--tRNA-(uracil(54)-C(5))-methyltransferase (FADH(2)-oxidizing) TrmFO [Candidatus Alcyoniella australis]|nr:methylenetetrahydrofolate--tRNA-(uracil(54)-C(5))-methyltransferase (FADH(2)-oxidizing) TrmFO [Candidatus Alcyoniella australis]
MHPTLTIIGGGLAGCEAAWQAARAGVRVKLYEQRPQRSTPAHSGEGLAELVCSNSLRSDRLVSGPGLLKAELRCLDSLLIASAERCRVPAGAALAVNRDQLSTHVEEQIAAQPLIELKREHVECIPEGPVIIAAGPLISDELAAQVATLCGRESLHFYDATSPIVDAASIDLEHAFYASRYDRGDPEDYLNCPLDQEQYERFIEAAAVADRVRQHEFEHARFFEGCLPIEVMIQRGPLTLAHGPLKPVGLSDPRGNARPFAVVQLRRENNEGSCYSLVGFQTRLKWPEQDRVFRLIPALRNAEFLRYGSIHRNTFLDSPGLLDDRQRLISLPRLRFAGQITGVEGYVESIASGLLAGLSAAAQMREIELPPPPRATALGSLIEHVSGARERPFEPSNIHFGLFPPPPQGTRKRDRKQSQADRAMAEIERWAVDWVQPLLAV